MAPLPFSALRLGEELKDDGGDGRGGARLKPVEGEAGSKVEIGGRTFKPETFDAIYSLRGDKSNDDLSEPGDDPRFIIWNTPASSSSSCYSPANRRPSFPNTASSFSPTTSTPPNSFARTRSGLRSRSNSTSDVASTRTSSSGGGKSSTDLSAVPPISPIPNAKSVIVAATIERWVAHLTSVESNQDKLFDFLLTYRAYLTPLELCRLLMVRFEWACCVKDPDAKLERGQEQEVEGEKWKAAKLMARTRTYRFWSFWLLNFFEEDWQPDRELRGVFTDWLNAMRERKDLKALTGAMVSRLLSFQFSACPAAANRSVFSFRIRTVQDIIKKLKHRVKERRANYDQSRPPNVEESQSFEKNSPYAIGRDCSSTLPLSPSHQRYRPPIPFDSTISPESHALQHHLSSSTSNATFGRKKQQLVASSTSANIALPLQNHSVAKFFGSLSRVARSTLVGSSNGSSRPILSSNSFDISRQALALGSLAESSKQGSLDAYMSAYSSSTGSNGSWSQTSVGAPLQQQQQPSSGSDTRGSVEELSLSEESLSPERRSATTLALDPVTEERASAELSRTLELEPEVGLSPTLPSIPAPSPTFEAPVIGLSDVEPTALPTSGSFSSLNASPSPAPPSTLASPAHHPSPLPIPAPTAIFGFSSIQPSSQLARTEIVPFQTVNIDDASLSDSDDDSSSYHRPIEPRRLPGGQQHLQLVRRSLDSLNSVVPGAHGTPQRGSTYTSESHAYGDRPGSEDPFDYSNIGNFNREWLESDEEDEGGPEAALRRLMGVVDTEKQKRKEAKVAEWVEMSKRGRTNTNDEEDPRFRRESLIDPIGYEEKEKEASIKSIPAPPSAWISTARPNTTTSLPKSPSVSSMTPNTPTTLSDRALPEVETIPPFFSPSSPRQQPASPSQLSTAPTPTRPPSRPASHLKSLSASLIPTSSSSRFSGLHSSPTKRTSLMRKRRPSETAETSGSSSNKGKGILGPKLREQPKPNHRSFMYVLHLSSFFLFYFYFFIILLQELSRLILHLSFSLLSSLDVRTELLATQFYIIDAALLKAIGSEELARSPSPWLLLNSKLSPADRWEDSLREKTVAKTDPTRTKLSDVAMMVTRFELMARWVETEVVITEKAGRVALVNRFIKLAAKCYSLNNLLYVPPPIFLLFLQ
jgi:hypothetical protein